MQTQTGSIKYKRVNTRVFDFTDYRTFLAMSFRDMKARNPQFTYNAWAKSLGLKNSSSLLKIINGEREAGQHIIEKLCQFFQFSTDERQYFEDLIRLSKSQGDIALQMLVLDRIHKNNPKKDFRILEHDEFQAISSWWYYGLRQLAKLKTPMKNDPEFLAKCFKAKVRPEDLKQAIKVMCDLGLMTQDSASNTLHTEAKSLNTTDDISSEAIKRFHESILELAKQALRSEILNEREISGITASVCAEDLPKIKAFIRKTQDQFCVLFANKPQANLVYQFENAFFPLTYKIEGELNNEK